MALIPIEPHTAQRKHARTSVRLAVLLLATLGVTAALAGCTTDRDNDEDRNVSLSYEGEEAGNHSDVADCNEDGLITSTGVIDAGNLTITVTDGAGDTIYEQNLNGTLSGDSEGISGEAGQWTLEVTREDGFDGQYVVNLGC